MSVASLQVTKTYADGLAWTEARMDTAMQSIQTYTNTSLVNNFNQLRKDIAGTSYDYDNDGNANFSNPIYTQIWGRSYTNQSNRKLYTELYGKDSTSTARTKSLYAEAFGASPAAIASVRSNSLFNKQTASVSYTAADITLGTAAAAITETSASLRMIFTPEATGKYNISYTFMANMGITNGGGATAYYSIVNKTSGATLGGVGVRLDPTAGAGNTLGLSWPVHISRNINLSSVAAATYGLYVHIRTGAASISSHRLPTNATSKVGIYGQIHKI